MTPSLYLTYRPYGRHHQDPPASDGRPGPRTPRKRDKNSTPIQEANPEAPQVGVPPC
jgi:hypothetical protein